MHKILGHCREEKLNSFYKNHQVDNPAVTRAVKRVCKQCNICKNSKKSPKTSPNTKVNLIKPMEDDKRADNDDEQSVMMRQTREIFEESDGEDENEDKDKKEDDKEVEQIEKEDTEDEKEVK